MKALSLIFIFSLFVSCPVYSQTNVPSTPAGNPATIDIWRVRQDLVISDIQKDIAGLKRKDQARAYIELGNLLWTRDHNEGAYWINEGVDLALGPNAAYEDTRSQLEEMTSLLIFQDILVKNNGAGRKLLKRITELLFAEVKQNGPDGYGGSAQMLANHMISRDPQLAFELARIAFRDRKNGYSSETWKPINGLKKSNEPLSNKLFEDLLNEVRQSGDDSRMSLLAIGVYGFNLVPIPQILRPKFDPFNTLSLKLTPQQKGAVLKLIASFVEKEAQALAVNKVAECKVTARWGVRLFGEFKQFLPEAIPLIEQAVALCRARNPEAFVITAFDTADEYIRAAKKTLNKRTRSNYFHQASAIAYEEKNYRLSVMALDSMDEEFRAGYNWTDERIRSTAGLLNELFAARDFAGIDRLLEAAPSRLRGQIILKAEPVSRTQSEQSLRLIERAKLEFREMDFPEPARTGNSWALNPARFETVFRLYAQLGDQYLHESIAAFEEFVDLQNQLTRRFSNRTSEGKTLAYTCYIKPPKTLIETQFDRFYQNFVRFENTRVRLFYRLQFLRAVIDRDSGGGWCGAMEIDS